MVNSGEIIKEEDGNLVDEVTLGFEAVTKTPNEAMISAEGIVVALEEALVAIGSCKIGDIKTTIPVEEEDGSLVDEVTLGFEAVTKTPNGVMTSVEGIEVALEEASAVTGFCRIGDIRITIPVEGEDLGGDLHPIMANRVATIDKT